MTQFLRIEDVEVAKQLDEYAKYPWDKMSPGDVFPVEKVGATKGNLSVLCKNRTDKEPRLGYGFEAITMADGRVAIHCVKLFGKVTPHQAVTLWWTQVLERGSFFPGSAWPSLYQNDLIYQSYTDFAKKEGYGALHHNELFRTLRKLWPAGYFDGKHRMSDSARSWAKKVPPLEECRELMERVLS